MNDPQIKYFLPYQIKWINDHSPLRIIEKSRQVGLTYADAFYSVEIASATGARFDVYISTRDKFQARLSIEDCKRWAEVLEILVVDLGELIFDEHQQASAYVIQFSNGRIYSLSSNPNALTGKRGHVKLDEFALHQDQRLLYRIAKPVTQWGGTLSIISTHRGHSTLFNQIIRDIRQNGNPMGWSLFSYPIQKAVEEGIVERINEKSGRNESSEDFLKGLLAECIDEEQWLQEYCCTPADESSAFISYEMIQSCEDPNLHIITNLQTGAGLPPLPGGEGRGEGELYCPPSITSSLHHSTTPSLYLGVDVARKHDLCVLDLGEKIGDVMWDRLRIELAGKTFSEIEFELHRLLRLTQLKRCCIDATGLGMQLAERARQSFGWKVEPIAFTAAVKEQLAFALRADMEDRRLRIPCNNKLRADLRGIKKEISLSGNIRFVGETDDSHCDRFWAKALRQHAARPRHEMGALVC